MRGFLPRARCSPGVSCALIYSAAQVIEAEERKKQSQQSQLFGVGLSCKDFPKIFLPCKRRDTTFPRRDKIPPRVFPNARRFAVHKASRFQRSATVLENGKKKKEASQRQLKITPLNLRHSVHAKPICAPAVPRCVNK